MIKILEDLLIEATTNPNVPGHIVAGLRKAVDAARSAALPEPPVVLGYDKIIGALRTAHPPAAADMLPPPFDSQEEAQRAAGIWPQEAEPATVRVAHPYTAHFVRLVAGDGYEAGQVVANLPPEPLRERSQWAPCDKDGWVSAAIGSGGIEVEFRGSRDGGANPTDWRPLPPKPSAIDEMAEQMKRWAAPTREDFDKAVNDLSEAMGVPKRRLLGQAREVPPEPLREDSKPTNPKDAAATDRVPLGLLSPIAKAHWALAQHCGRAKYGAWNWREAGVRASVYIDAIGRHTDGYLSGETYDPADGTHNLGNIMACCAILLEAEAAGKLTDDRPPTLDMRPTYAEVQRRLADLTAKYADRNPKHWTR